MDSYRREVLGDNGFQKPAELNPKCLPKGISEVCTASRLSFPQNGPANNRIHQVLEAEFEV
jgi:hypothetical protein